MRHGDTASMLSTADTEKVKHYLPRRDATEKELFRLLQEITIDDNEPLPRTGGDLRQSDKVEFVRDVTLFLFW